MRQLIVLCLATLPTTLAQGQPTPAATEAEKNHESKLQVRLGIDVGYQLTTYEDGFWSGDTGLYHGPALSTDIFILRKLGRWGSAATGVRLSVGYGRGTGTYEDGEGFNPAGGSGLPPEEHGLRAWYLQGSVLYVFANDYAWVGAGLGGRYQHQAVESLGENERGEPELVLAGGAEFPLLDRLSLTAEVEVSTNLFISTSVAGNAGLKLRF